MFLKQLWHFNKYGTVFFLLFIFMWIFLNVKQGAVATPLLQYGMYSSRHYINDTQHLLHLFINKNRVDFTKYSTAEKDHLQTYLEYYLIQKNNNDVVFNTVRRILKKTGIGWWMKYENYTNNINDRNFTIWYKSLAEKITGEKISSLEAFQQKYIWHAGQLTAVGTPVKVDCIVPY